MQTMWIPFNWPPCPVCVHKVLLLQAAQAAFLKYDAQCCRVELNAIYLHTRTRLCRIIIMHIGQPQATQSEGVRVEL